MSLILFYDTETTGVPLFKDPSDDPRQPHIVEVAAALVDSDTRRSVASLHLIVRPDGWVIPEEMTAIHGITTERALQLGVSEDVATLALLSLWRCADLRVGHNESFDARIVRIALKRHVSNFAADDWKEGAKFCTCFGARPFTALPKNKLPTLSEACMHFFGEELANAHSAKADMQATADVYWEIQRVQEEARTGVAEVAPC